MLEGNKTLMVSFFLLYQTQYGQSYAAVQVLLESLKQNHMATKWITGPVTRTPAFRQHAGAQTNDRVVGLVLVG